MAGIYFIDNDSSVYEGLLCNDAWPSQEFMFYASSGDLIAALNEQLPLCLIIEANLKPYGGVALYKDLLANQLAPPTIFVATFGTIYQAVEVMKLGAIDYIEKPFLHSRLIAAISRIDGCTARP